MTNVARLPNRRTIDKWAELIKAAWRVQVPSIFETGNLLEAAKIELPHGEWLVLINDKLDFGPRTVQRLIAIARNDNLRDVNATHASHLPAVWMTLYELTKLTSDQFESGMKSGAINPRMERKDVLALRGLETKPKPKKKEIIHEDYHDWLGAIVADVTAGAASIPKKDLPDFFARLRNAIDQIENPKEQV